MMRTTRYMVALAGLSGIAIVVHAGCGTTLDDTYKSLTDPNLAGVLPPDCLAEPSSNNVLDACGVFVRADAPPHGDGTQARPLARLPDAITQAESTAKRVYACAGTPFTEPVTISKGIEVWGGFDCAKGWTWSRDARTELNGPPDKIPLAIEKSAGDAKIEGFKITAARPSVMNSGGSSIAVVVDDVAVTMERCDVIASDATDGADGNPPSMPGTNGMSAPMPDAIKNNACTNPASVSEGMPGVTMCDDGPTSGGAGGKGGLNGNGGDGEAGEPSEAMSKNEGAGATVTNGCSDGASGKDGVAGAAGVGGSAAGDTLSQKGITNNDVTDGQPGTDGQGGGGGGGDKSGMFCSGPAMSVGGNGASGGGSGAGGCGGKGGRGGKAGGSSIGIVSLGTQLVLTEVTMATGAAGNGGHGVAQQTGGVGGVGALGGASSGIFPSADGCMGGHGGKGGPGGAGGGGRGGHAIGIAYAKTPGATPVIKTFTPGMPGLGGTAASGAPASSNGAPGNAAQCWDFAANHACM